MPIQLVQPQFTLFEPPHPSPQRSPLLTSADGIHQLAQQLLQLASEPAGLKREIFGCSSIELAPLCEVLPPLDNLDLLFQKAYAGDAEAQFEMAYECYTGLCVEKNDLFAQQWLQNAANQNHPQALFTLAHMDWLRIGDIPFKLEEIPFKLEKIRSRLEFASELGCRDAMYFLSLGYSGQLKSPDGQISFPLDPERAKPLLAQALRKRQPNAFAERGFQCLQRNHLIMGRTILEQVLKEIPIYGFPFSIFFDPNPTRLMLAEMCIEGKGGEVDIELARELLADAAEIGSERAKELLRELSVNAD